MPQNHILVRKAEGTPMESHPYTKPRGVGPVTTQLPPGAEPASWKSAGAPGPWSCSPTCRAWSESSRPSLTDSTSTGAGCTCSPCNDYWATPSAFLHKQLDVTVVTSSPGAEPSHVSSSGSVCSTLNCEGLSDA